MDPLKQVAFKPKKVFWKEKGTKPYSFICPLCTSQRKIPYQPRPTPRHYVQIGLTAACLMLLTWPIFGWKGFVSFIPLWTVFEILYRGKVRGALSCPQCGFDAYLYMVDVKRARTEVESHWRKKFADKGIPYPEKPQPLEPPTPPSSGVLLASNVKKPKNHYN
jgi:hypothetical protein